MATEISLKQLPAAIAAQARAAGVVEADCLYCVQSDLALDGAVTETWLVVTKTQVASFTANASGAPAAGPFTLKAVQKVRAFPTVGSSVLQVQVDGLYVGVIRFSNARRESFGRARVQLERLVKGEEYVAESLTRPSDFVCQTCGLPLPGRGGACPKCNLSHGILLRSCGLMKPYASSIVFLFVVMLLGVGLDLIPAQLTRVMVDKILAPHGATAEATLTIQQQNTHWLPWILCALVGTSALRMVLNMLIGRTSSIVGTRITKELRMRLQAKMVSLSVDYYNRHSVGSMMSRVMNDVDYFQGFVAQVAQGFMLNIMLVLGIGAMLFYMNWVLALWVLLPIPFVVVGTIFFWKHIYPLYYRYWDSQSKMAQMLSGLLTGIRLVKAFSQEGRERDRFEKVAGYSQTSRRGLEIGSAIFNPLMGFVFGLGGLIVWYAGGHKVLDGHITLGTLMAFFGYLGMFYAPISALSMFSNWVTGFLSAGQRVFEVLDSSTFLPQPKAPVRLPSAKGAIEFRNVTFGYDPYTPILKNVSFKIEPGQFIGIVGKSGSGKTTLVNVVCRFYDVQQGSVLLDGVDVRELDQADLHRQVGLVLQDPFLFRATIAENIAYGRPEASMLAIMDAARAANAHDFIAKRTSAYDTKLGESGAGLSGGERQRISIARALLCDPRVLILDEATSSVDTESELEIQKALTQLCKGRTTIAIAHRLSTLKNSDRIFVVDEGKIAEQGTHEELLALKDGIYHKLVKIQTELTRLEE